MNTATVIALASPFAAAVGAVFTWWRSRRRESVDLVKSWEANYGQLLERVTQLAAALDAETQQRVELERRFQRALTRIDYLERRLTAAGVEFNGPPV